MGTQEGGILVFLVLGAVVVLYPWIALGRIWLWTKRTAKQLEELNESLTLLLRSRSD